ncbi:unnamed protein product [Sphagnum balticum]
MVIFASMIAVLNEHNEVCIVQRDYEVSSIGYLMRSEVKNSFKFVVRESFPCISKHTRNSVIHDDKVGDKWRSFKGDENLAIEAITEEFKRFQEPKNADKLTKALEEVDSTKIILHDSIKKLLERQGDLDKLVEKSKDLSEGAKQFYKTSKKMDKSCC